MRTNPSEAYLAALRHVLTEGDRVSPRGLPCREVLDLVVTVTQPDDDPIVTRDAMRNHRMAKYLDAEFLLYARGEERASEFARHAPFWETIADPDGKVNSAYGKIIWFDETVGRVRQMACTVCGTEDECPSCLGVKVVEVGKHVTPWEWARDSLVRDVDTRQAVLLFMRPDHLFETKDVVCTMHGQFTIRRGELNLTIVMRSNDLVRGMAYDMPWFMYLMTRMRDQLSSTYPDLRLGTYRHIAHSAHVYERDLETAWSMLGEKPPVERMPAEESMIDGELDRLTSMFGG